MISSQNTSNSGTRVPVLKELSLNVLDIAQNSIRANASLIEISLKINTFNNLLNITVRDNGQGFDMSSGVTYNAPNTPKASNTERKNGFGIPIFKESAEKTGGRFCITSQVGVGTAVSASFNLNHPSCSPIGDMPATIETLILCCKDIDFIYTYKVDGEGFTLNTAKIKDFLENIPINAPEIMEQIRIFLRENTDSINKNIF